MPDIPTISILIPAYNEQQLLPATIDSIRQSFAALNHNDYEIIVCDNNSTDSTAAVAQSLGCSVVFEPHNQIARARNAAASAARGHWFIFIDADSYLSPELLQITLDNLASRKICAGGAVVDLVDTPLPLFARILTATWNRIAATFHIAAGSYIYCTRDAFQGAGGFNNSIYAGEELNFTADIKKWARQHQLKFKVINQVHIRSSARKIAWYSTAHILKQLFITALPGSRGKPNRLKFWYQRPDK